MKPNPNDATGAPPPTSPPGGEQSLTAEDLDQLSLGEAREEIGMLKRQLEAERLAVTQAADRIREVERQRDGAKQTAQERLRQSERLRRENESLRAQIPWDAREAAQKVFGLKERAAHAKEVADQEAARARALHAALNAVWCEARDSWIGTPELADQVEAALAFKFADAAGCGAAGDPPTAPLVPGVEAPAAPAPSGFPLPKDFAESLSDALRNGRPHRGKWPLPPVFEVKEVFSTDPIAVASGGMAIEPVVDGGNFEVHPIGTEKKLHELAALVSKHYAHTARAEETIATRDRELREAQQQLADAKAALAAAETQRDSLRAEVDFGQAAFKTTLEFLAAEDLKRLAGAGNIAAAAVPQLREENERLYEQRHALAIANAQLASMWFDAREETARLREELAAATNPEHGGAS